ncbi:cilia- and flagella-associated protein 99 [Aplysia californica]|uniref:Cilia- and flagella-associated protein 99 n=1 Tax=Aplysia californica TaxID=6500 RepID=A0ABM1VZN3_APLCA|nr:cilia- and flagella-associated protein 99 [Aplysia californica]
MDTKHQQLLIHCACLLDTYDAGTQGLEQHVENYIRANKITDEDDEMFITEVFSGCVRHGAVMRVVVEGFYARDGRNVLRSTENVYIVICYLALFRLDELGIAHFRKFISALEVKAAYKFLNFFFDEKSLLTWMKDGWNKVYESTFIQKSILSPLLRWLPELEDLVKQLKDKMDNKLKPKKSKIPTTETSPFNLTKPRPRSIPIPEKVPKLKKSKPPPDSLYRAPTEQDELSRHKEENRRRAEERLMEASRIQFSCANPEKSDKTKQILQIIQMEENDKIDGNRIKARPAPDFKKDPLPVKMTAAAILREGNLYQKKEEEVVKKLRQLEAGAYDASDFLKWQSEMRQMDLEAELSAVEERRLKGKLSHEEAILARANLMADNQTKVQDIKNQTAAMMREHLEQKFQEEKEMKMLVENTMAGHRNAKESKKRLQEYKQKLVQEVTEESRELMKQALEEAEADMRCKMELIQQIRAMEATPVSRFKQVDLASTAGAGLLGEMSILELRERVALLKDKQREEEEMKRDNILNAKQAKAEQLSETMDMVLKHRAEQTRAAALKLEDRKKSSSASAPFRNEKLMDLERKVQERRAQRLREQQRQQLQPSMMSARRTTTLITQKKALEASRWHELEQTQERSAKMLSQSPLMSAASRRLTAVPSI